MNNDRVKDVAIVIQTKDSILEKRCNSCYASYKKGRILLILLSKGIDTTVVFQHNTFIARPDEGAMVPNLEPDLSIEQNKLTIDYQYVRGHTSYIFKLTQNDLELIAAKSSGVSGENISNIDFNFETMTLIDTEGKIGEDSSKVDTIHLPFSKMKRLSEMKVMYDWEVIKNIFL